MGTRDQQVPLVVEVQRPWWYNPNTLSKNQTEYWGLYHHGLFYFFLDHHGLL